MCGGSAGYDAYLDTLVGAGLLIPSGVRGVYGRSGSFEAVVEGIEGVVTRRGRSQQAEVMRFPPILNRAHYQRLSHIHQFPDLLGSVHVFTGDERQARAMGRAFDAEEDWTQALTPAETMLIPAACYPLYPTATGTLSDEGRVVDLRSYVFRHEPSDDPARMQIFRQREYVRLGTAEQALEHRNTWRDQSLELLRGLGLDAEVVVANDPFFGRGGRLAAATQREQTLKFEIVVSIAGEEPTAISSSNLHLDYFGQAFGIRTPDGSAAHTACVGFGLERVTLALIKTHGTDPYAWPEGVRQQLALD